MSITLHQHQSEGVDTIIKNSLSLNNKGFLLSDEPGLGKTYTSAKACMQLLHIVKQFPDTYKHPNPRILVVCPLSVINHWEQSFKDLDENFLDFDVLNYSKVRRLFDITTSPTKRAKNKKDYTLKYSYSHIIFDESHSLKNYNSVAHKLALQLIDTSLFTLFVSATPGQSPLELAYLKPVFEFDNFFAWLSHNDFAVYKNKNFNNFEWSVNDYDLEKIQNMIYKSGKGLRRRACDISGWPELQIIPFPITLSTSELKTYNKSWDSYVNTRKKLGFKNYTEEVAKLVEVGILRQSISKLKIPYTITFALDQLNSGFQTAIFCEYLDTANELVKRLNDKKIKVGLLTGETDEQERYKVISKFREGKIQAVVFTISQSINLEQPSNLHAPRVQINHDVPWSGIKAIQLNGRCHRNGMHCLVYNMFSSHTIDESVVSRMTTRCQSVYAIAGDSTLNPSLLENEDSTMLEEVLFNI